MSDYSRKATRVFGHHLTPSKRRTTPRKLPQQDLSKLTVDTILTATAHILTHAAVVEYSDLLLNEQLEQEVSQMLL